jgi:hypothetical protein
VFHCSLSACAEMDPPRLGWLDVITAVYVILRYSGWHRWCLTSLSETSPDIFDPTSILQTRSACIECDKFDFNRLSIVEVVTQYKSKRFFIETWCIVNVYSGPKIMYQFYKWDDLLCEYFWKFLNNDLRIVSCSLLILYQLYKID